jgi:hypothetical protein
LGRSRFPDRSRAQRVDDQLEYLDSGDFAFDYGEDFAQSVSDRRESFLGMKAAAGMLGLDILAQSCDTLLELLNEAAAQEERTEHA